MSPFLKVICFCVFVVCMLTVLLPSAKVSKSAFKSSVNIDSEHKQGLNFEGSTLLQETDDELLQQHQHEEFVKDNNEYLKQVQEVKKELRINSNHDSSQIGQSILKNKVRSSTSSMISKTSLTKIDVSKFRPEEYAIVLYDSRPLKEGNYWLTAAAWNRKYCKQHGHTFVYYTLKPGEKCMSADLGHGSELLADAWCKVKAMMQANDDYPKVKIFIYMDSDAVIARSFDQLPLSQMLGTLQDRLQWDPEAKPMVFNQDGPCWWCKQVQRVGYAMCLNAGTVLWYAHPYSRQLLNEWWDAALDPYEGEGNPFKRKFRLKWPWEQDRQMAIYHRSPSRIQVASQPSKPNMDITAGHDDWCLSHLAKSGCFIAHYCEDKHSKQKMHNTYRLEPSETEDIAAAYL